MAHADIEQYLQKGIIPPDWPVDENGVVDFTSIAVVINLEQ